MIHIHGNESLTVGGFGGGGVHLFFLVKVQVGIAGTALHFCSSSAIDLLEVLRQSFKSAVSQHVFLSSTTKMSAELVTSANMVPLKNGVYFILSEAKVLGMFEMKRKC